MLKTTKHSHLSALLPIPGPPLNARRFPRLPTLRFSPEAWSKLLFLRDRGDTEIGGWGISAPGDPLLVVDVRLVRQNCDAARVAFADEAIAELFDELVDVGLKPEEFGRIWIHTHPGRSPFPSAVDEETFARAFGNCDWAVMAIIARGGASYARLRIGTAACVEVEIPLAIEFNGVTAGTDVAAWAAEYEACVTTAPAARVCGRQSRRNQGLEDWLWNEERENVTAER